MFIFKILKAIDKSIENFAKWSLVVCVFAMLFFSIATIVLRWVGITFLWIDPLVRYLVFLSAFLGGVLATGAKGHIGIDLTHKFAQKLRPWVSVNLERLVTLVSTVVLVWLVYASWLFVKVEWEFGHEAFLGIHNGIIVGIIPFGFALSGYRFFYLFMATFDSTKKEVLS